MTDDIDDQLGNTVEDWKRAVVTSVKEQREEAGESATREKLIIVLTAATLIVALVSLIVALVR